MIDSYHARLWFFKLLTWIWADIAAPGNNCNKWEEKQDFQIQMWIDEPLYSFKTTENEGCVPNQRKCAS